MCRRQIEVSVAGLCVGKPVELVLPFRKSVLSVDLIARLAAQTSGFASGLVLLLF
jgi:hypothetical protein